MTVSVTCGGIGDDSTELRTVVQLFFLYAQLSAGANGTYNQDNCCLLSKLLRCFHTKLE